MPILPNSVCNPSWIFKSMSAATADATASASAANKTCIFKRKMAVVSRKHQELTGNGK